MKNWFIVSLLSLLALVSCTNFVDEGAGLGGVKASVSQLSFSYSLSVQNFSVTSGEKWTVQQIPDWLRVSQISGRGYTWSVSLTSVENYGYDRSGVVTLHSSSSSAKIDVSQQGRLGAYVPVSSVSLSPQDLVITEGETRQLTATVYPSNASVKNVRWGTSSASVATVSSSGVVTAVSEGSATITVTTEDGSKTATCQVTVKRRVINVTGVSLNKTYITLTKGETSQLTATVSPSNATNKNVNWKSSSTSVATVSSSGLVTAVGGGTATITVTTEDGNYTATCKVTVKIPVTGVKLDQSELSLTEGETRQLTATVSPSDATNKTVNWKSSSTSVATVSSSGLVTAVGGGTATITVTTEDGNYTATCKVTVKIPVTGVKLDQSELSLTEGETRQLTATVSPSDATNKTVSWKSSSTAVATVSTSGLITAKAEGSATITVTTEDGSKTATCRVTVKKRVISVSGVSVSPTSVTLMEGDTYQLSATVSPSNASNKNVKWQSNSTSIATVSSSGLITAKAEGSATITVTTEDGSKTATCWVTVKKKVISVTGVSLNNTSVTLTEGETYQLSATVSPSNATNKNVSWYSSSASIATVSSSGLVKAVSSGKATIIVTTSDGSYTANCMVTVSVDTRKTDLLNAIKEVEDALCNLCSTDFSRNDSVRLIGSFSAFAEAREKYLKYTPGYPNLNNLYYTVSKTPANVVTSVPFSSLSFDDLRKNEGLRYDPVTGEEFKYHSAFVNIANQLFGPKVGELLNSEKISEANIRRYFQQYLHPNYSSPAFYYLYRPGYVNGEITTFYILSTGEEYTGP